MKKIIATLFLTGLLSQANASDKNLQDKMKAHKNAATYKIEQTNLQSTIYYDGESTIKYGIFATDESQIKVQLLWDQVPMMNIKYHQQSISDGLNLSQLPAGTYYIRIYHGTEVTEKRIFKIFNRATNVAAHVA
jgi:hypothetical protein